jgi:hypothetical protein
MYIYLLLYICMCLCIDICIHLHVDIYIYINICMYPYLYKKMYEYKYICIHDSVRLTGKNLICVLILEQLEEFLKSFFSISYVVKIIDHTALRIRVMMVSDSWMFIYDIWVNIRNFIFMFIYLYTYMYIYVYIYV